MLEGFFKKIGYSKVLNEEKKTNSRIDSKNKISRTIGVDEEFTYASASMTLGVQGIPQPKKLQTYEKYINLFGECVWVYACVYQIATSIAGVPFLLYKKPISKNSKPELVEDVNDPVMLLLANPNPWMGQYELKEAIMANLELTGNCYLEEVRKGAKLLELYPLQSHKVKIVPGRKTPVLGYVYEALGVGVPFNEDEITHIKYFNPKSDFYGASPLTAAEISTKADVDSGKWNKNFFENSARPDAVLETDSSLNPTLLDRLKSQWRLIHRGVSKSHDIAILEGGLTYV